MILLIFLVQQFHRLGRFFFAAGRDHNGHVVQQVKAVERRRCVARHGRRCQPRPAGTSGIFHDFFKTLIRPFAAGDLFQLMDRRPELCADIRQLGIAHFVIRVERHIDHDHRDIQLTRQILVPFDHAVADIVAAKQVIRLRHILLRALLDLRIRQTDTGIGTDIIGIAVGLADLTHALSGSARRNAGRLVFRIDNIQTQRLRDLDREITGAPAHQLAAGLCFGRVRVRMLGDFVQLVLG